MTNREFIELVAKTREVQKRWFGGDKSRDTLIEARQLERHLDEALAQIAGPPQQGTLFDVQPSGRGRNIGRLDAMIAVQREEDMRRVAESMKGGSV